MIATSTDQSHLQHCWLRQPNSDGQGGISFTAIGKCVREPQSGLEESIRAARMIYERAGDQLWLCLSGGIDSECMALAFLTAGIPFKVLIMRFNDNLNDHDYVYAVDFCWEHGISPEFFDLNVTDFYESNRHVDYAHLYRCNSPQLATHIELLKVIPGVPVMPWNPLAIRHQPEGFELGLPRDLHFCYDRFFQSVGRQGYAYFFLHTPELAYSFLRTPSSQDWLMKRGELKSRDPEYELKVRSFRESGFRFKERPQKYTGFEKVKIYFEKRYNETGPVFDRHFRWPLEKLYPREQFFYHSLPKRYLFINETSSQLGAPWQVQASNEQTRA